MRWFLGTFLSILLVTSVAMAADKTPNPQQERMKACNAEAGEKKLAGDERKAFISTCLKGQTPAPMSQQEKMKSVQQGGGCEGIEGGGSEEVHERMPE